MPGCSVLGIGDKSRDQRAVASDGESLWRRVMAMRSAVKREMKTGEFSVIASHFALYALPVLDVLKRVPHVVHFHGPWAGESAAEGSGRLSVAAKRFVEKRVYATAGRAIVLSNAFKRILVDDYGVDEQKVVVIPGGIDVPTKTMPDRRESRERLGWPTDRPIVFCVRRLARRMGIDVLIDAISIVKRSHPDVLVMIAGKGQQQSELQSKIDAASLADHVRLLGFVPDDELPIAYAAADLSVVPSQSLEGFGLVTIESLVQGTPVLVTPVGGLPEVVEGLDPLLILESSRSDAIAGGISNVLSNLSSLPTREACRAYAVEHFAWPTIAGRVARVYEQAIEDRAP